MAPEEFIAQVGLKPRELDILDGSPPCSQFSIAGRGLSERFEEKAYSDKSQRGIGTLFYDFFFVAKRALPKVVVAENVPNLASRKNGALFNEFLDALRYKRLKDRSKVRVYYAGWRVLSSHDFGVPQDRRRLFVIGVRKDVGEKVGITSDEDVARVFPDPPCRWVTIRAAFKHLKQRNRRCCPVAASYDDFVDRTTPCEAAARSS